MPLSSMPPVTRNSKNVVSAGLTPSEAQAFRDFAQLNGRSRNYLIRRYVRYVSGLDTEPPLGIEQQERAA